eukprot:11211581-Lingulodinium_polyedra.AAC.1
MSSVVQQHSEAAVASGPQIQDEQQGEVSDGDARGQQDGLSVALTIVQSNLPPVHNMTPRASACDL